MGEGIVLVRGSDGKGWALLGRGKGTGKGTEAGGEMRMRGEVQAGGEVRVRWVGCEIRVRRPVWEVDLLGERWTVGVDWEIYTST